MQKDGDENIDKNLIETRVTREGNDGLFILFVLRQVLILFSDIYI